MLGVEHACGFGEDELVDEAGGDLRDGKCEDFLLDFGSDSAGCPAVDFVFIDEGCDNSGLIPGAGFGLPAFVEEPQGVGGFVHSG